MSGHYPHHGTADRRAWARDETLTERSRRAAVEFMGREFERKRAAEIEALPSKLWKGRRLHALTCRAEFGKGPHVLYLPASLLWQLLDFEHYRCPFHC